MEIGLSTGFQFSSVQLQDGIYALGKAHMRPTPSQEFPQDTKRERGAGHAGRRTGHARECVGHHRHREIPHVCGWTCIIIVATDSYIVRPPPPPPSAPPFRPQPCLVLTCMMFILYFLQVYFTCTTELRPKTITISIRLKKTIRLCVDP